MSQDDTGIPSLLCASCSSIDFKGAFVRLPRLGLPGHEIPQTMAITATRKDIQADCSLCSFVFERIFSDINLNDRVSAIGEIGYHFRAVDSLWVSRKPLLSRPKENSDVVIAIVRGGSDQKLNHKQLLQAISLGLIVPLAQRSALDLLESPGYCYGGRMVNSLSPDFNRLRSWIDECNSLQSDCHVDCKSSPGDVGFQTRVIDCWTRQIVPLTRDLEYLTLSYVWGNSIGDKNPQISQTSGFVPFPAPQTIEDAISVVRNMEKRYLWIDRYCIWQSENRQLQIQNMDEIYRNALSTIVPVEADSAETGFSGVSSPRCDQFKIWTNAGVLVFTFPHISYHLSSSVWMTRGWTYQEAVLSRSCMFFTKDQVYFACRSAYQSEAVEQAEISLRDPYRETLEPRLLSHADYVYPLGRPGYREHLYYEHIKAYTSRSLTLDSDGLNAFEGIIKSGRTKSLWGIVGYRDHHDELGFAVGLGWCSLRKPPEGGPVRRREEFPTWSWVSLVDQIEHAMVAIGTSSGLAGCSIFYIEDENGKRVRFADTYRRVAEYGTLLFSNFGKALFIKARIAQVRLVWSKKAGICSVYASKRPSKSLFHSRRDPSSSPLEVAHVMARIDSEDAGLVSDIESRPWHAVQLFWTERIVPAGLVRQGYWMLVDKRERIAHRIGIIIPVHDEGLFWEAEEILAQGKAVRMQNLKTRRRLIRIE